jgi:hypothetical protein
MEQNKKKPTQLDKNGNPVRRPSKAPKAGAKRGGKFDSKPWKKPGAQSPKAGQKPPRGKKPQNPAPTPPAETFPMDWIFLHAQDCPVQTLKELAAARADLDIETWPELGILEVTFPSKTFVDFEQTAELPDEPAIQAFLAQHPYKTAYYVSVEPVCTKEELDFLRDITARSGGILVADNDQLSPVFGG